MKLNKDNLTITCRDKEAKELIKKLIEKDYCREVSRVEQTEKTDIEGYYQYTLEIVYEYNPLSTESSIVAKRLIHDNRDVYKVCELKTQANREIKANHYLPTTTTFNI